MQIVSPHKPDNKVSSPTSYDFILILRWRPSPSCMSFQFIEFTIRFLLLLLLLNRMNEYGLKTVAVAYSRWVAAVVSMVVWLCHVQSVIMDWKMLLSPIQILSSFRWLAKRIFCWWDATVCGILWMRTRQPQWSIKCWRKMKVSAAVFFEIWLHEFIERTCWPRFCGQFPWPEWTDRHSTVTKGFVPQIYFYSRSCVLRKLKQQKHAYVLCALCLHLFHTTYEYIIILIMPIVMFRVFGDFYLLNKRKCIIRAIQETSFSSLPKTQHNGERTAHGNTHDIRMRRMKRKKYIWKYIVNECSVDSTLTEC